jgi:molybdopterin synthase sulfur carrier subunit
MQITVKLFATFRQGRFSIETREYPPGTRVGQIVEEIGIPKNELGIILVNSRHVDLTHELGEGDTLALFPLVGGG